jgi:hypothetical protein
MHPTFMPESCARMGKLSTAWTTGCRMRAI